MGSKKRRKSAGPPDEPQRKRSSSASARPPAAALPLAWTSAGVRAVLPAERALLFVGRGTLAVQSGEVAVAGRVVSAATGPMELSADERVGGPLILQVHSAEGQVPLASRSEAVFSLARSSDQVAPRAVAGSAAAGRPARLGFEAYLDDDPAAPVALPLPPLWHQAAGEVAASVVAGAAVGAQPALVVVCGAKKVGKSTFARLLTNMLLNHHPAVAFLDTDCGQPEFTPPGLVSLSIVRQPVVGPPHMHLGAPALTHFVGDLSPSSDPVAYLAHIRSLHSWYFQHGAAAVAASGHLPDALGASGGAPSGGRAHAVPPPLVVNTHGWVKGLGFDVLVEMLAGLPVTHCVQIASSNSKKNLPPGCFWLPPAEPAPAAAPPPQPLHWLLPPAPGAEQQQQQQQQAASQGQQPAASETSARSLGPAASEGGSRSRPGLSAVEQRALQWLAFAQQCVANSSSAGCATEQVAGGDSSSGEPADPGDVLAAAVPFEVDLSDVEVQVLHSAVAPSQLAYALNASVVGLCGPAPEQGDAAMVGTVAATAADSLLAAPPPSSLPCLGLGVVRAADARSGRLHVLTPVAEGQLERVTALQVGRLELPAALLQTGAFLCPYLSLFGMSTAGTGSGAIKSRNNLVRLSQL
eukprot:scaffold1.g5329.t1